MPNGIPDDPRDRTRNHARLDVTFWLNVPDEVLENSGVKDATELLRNGLKVSAPDGAESIEEFNKTSEIVLGYPALVDVTYRVGK